MKTKMKYIVRAVVADHQNNGIAVEAIPKTDGQPPACFQPMNSPQTDEERMVKNIFKAMENQMPGMRMMTMGTPPNMPPMSDRPMMIFFTHDQFEEAGNPNVGDELEVTIEKKRKAKEVR